VSQAPVQTQLPVVAGAPSVRKGTCYVVHAFDVAQWVDLERCKQLIKETIRPVRFQHRYRAPHYFQFHPEPLSVLYEGPAIRLGQFETLIRVEVSLYNFGAVSVSYMIALDRCTLEDLVEISFVCSDGESLRQDSRQHVEELMAAIAPAATKLGLAQVTEDYLIFEIEELEHPMTGAEMLERYGADLARILRAEREALSPQEITDALGRSCSFGRTDLTLIDWNASLIFDKDADDIRSVLEFVNVQLLEMRYLDSQLDDSLDHSYETIGRQSWWELIRTSRTDLRRVGRLQIESAILFERVHNALKLLGDQYLARLYRLTAERFRLSEWNASILRKLDTIESIYQKLHDRAATQRLEVLEWIIIVLIAVSIFLPFLVPGK
jgi:hypothetical protein